MRRLGIVAAGLALVVGSVVGNLFDASASPGGGTYAILAGGLAGVLAALIASSLYMRSRLGR